MATQTHASSHTSGHSAKDRRTFPRLVAIILILSAIVWLIPTVTTQASSGGGHVALTGGYIAIPDNETLKPAAVTVEAWANNAEYQGSNQYIVFKQNSRYPNYVEGYTIYVNGPAEAPHFGGCVSSAAGEQVAVGAAGVITGTWYHLAMTADANNISFYVTRV
ncbi:MAG: LamG-like jellyroll fold domain-containing protein [Anaerolineae bacterium]